jgi:hypothetical protein
VPRAESQPRSALPLEPSCAGKMIVALWRPGQGSNIGYYRNSDRDVFKFLSSGEIHGILVERAAGCPVK